MVNFLAHLFSEGYQYLSINSYRSAIPPVHEKVDGCELGEHPLVSRTIKEFSMRDQPQPRYSETWHVATVTKYMESLGENESLSLAELTHKTVMLLALTRPSRSAGLTQLHLKFRHYLPKGVTMKLGPERPDRKQGWAKYINMLDVTFFI